MTKRLSARDCASAGDDVTTAITNRSPRAPSTGSLPQSGDTPRLQAPSLRVETRPVYRLPPSEWRHEELTTFLMLDSTHSPSEGMNANSRSESVPVAIIIGNVSLTCLDVKS